MGARIFRSLSALEIGCLYSLLLEASELRFLEDLQDGSQTGRRLFQRLSKLLDSLRHSETASAEATVDLSLTEEERAILLDLGPKVLSQLDAWDEIEIRLGVPQRMPGELLDMLNYAAPSDVFFAEEEAGTILLNEAPRPPITIAEGHDINVFESIPGLLDYIEWIDVEDGVYEAWDARGRKIRLYVENEEIKLALIPGEANQANQLMELLKEDIHSVGPERYRLFKSDDVPLSELLEVVLDAKKHGLVNQPPSRLRRAFRKWFGS